MSTRRPVALGVDVGTTHVKVLALSLEGEVLAVARADTPMSDDGTGPVHEAGALATLVTQLAHEATETADGAIRSVAVASIGEEGFWLDRADRVTYPSLAWYAPRPTPEFESFARERGAWAFERCGVLADPIRTLAKWMWLRAAHPEALAEARTWLSVSEYLAFCWSGVKVMTRSQASRTLLWDLKRERVLVDLLADLSFDPDCLAPVVPSGTVLGPLRPNALPGSVRTADATVIAAGHDHPVGAYAAGVVASGQILDSLGTAESLMMPTAAARPKRWMITQGLEFGASAGGLPHYVMAASHSGAHLKAWTSLLCRDAARLEREAEEVPPGAGGLRLHPPGWRMGQEGALLGLGPDASAAALFRSLLEGWAFWSRLALERLGPVAEPPSSADRKPPGAGSRTRTRAGTTIEQEAEASGPVPLTAIGGGSEWPLAMRIRASVLGRDIETVDAPEAVALGSARLALAAVRPDMPGARIPHRRISPDPTLQDVYDGLYRRWLSETDGLGAILNVHDEPRRSPITGQTGGTKRGEPTC